MERESARPAIDRMNPVGRIERLAVGALVDHRGLAKAPRERPELRQVGREPAQLERPVRGVERDDFLAFEHPQGLTRRGFDQDFGRAGSGQVDAGHARSDCRPPPA